MSYIAADDPGQGPIKNRIRAEVNGEVEFQPPSMRYSIPFLCRGRIPASSKEATCARVQAEVRMSQT